MQAARVALVGVLLFVMLQPFRFVYEFEKSSLVEFPQRTNQYTRASLKERREIRSVAGVTPVLLSSAVSTYTGLANIATLLSNLRLAVPPQFLKFFFLADAPKPEDYYCAPLVLVPQLYLDVYHAGKLETIYSGSLFQLAKNDLILFFDAETFPIKHGFDRQFLKQRSYIQARILGRDTIIDLCSSRARTVRLRFTYTALSRPRHVELLVKPSVARSRMVLGPEGTASVPGVHLLRGENHIELKPERDGQHVDILEIAISER